MAELSPLWPWALVGLVVAGVLARDPPSLAFARFDAATPNALRQEEVFAELRTAHADALLMGDSRFRSAFEATDLPGWFEACGLEERQPVSVFAPSYDFSRVGPMVPRLRALGARLVVLQLDLFLVDTAGSGKERGQRSTRAESALVLGRELVNQLRTAGATVVVVDLPRSEVEAARRGPEFTLRWEEGVRQVAALDLRMLRSETLWEDAYYGDHVHFNAAGAARARRWLCGALPRALSEDAAAHR